MASKIDSGDVLGRQAEKKTFLLPRGRLKDLFWGTMWESKLVPNPAQKRFQDAYDIEERCGLVFGRLGHQFLSVF